jgi:hypothetical protein
MKKHHDYRFKMQKEFNKLRLERNRKSSKVMKEVSKHLFNPICFEKIGKIVDNSGLSEGFLNNLHRSKVRRRKKRKNRNKYDVKKKLSYINY